MSVVTSKAQGRLRPKSSRLDQPYILAIGGLGILIAIWAALTIGSIEHGRLLLQLFILNVATQLGIIAIRRTGIAFTTSQAVNLATISVFGVRAGILVALFSAAAVWLVMTVRKKPPLKRALQTLVFNSGVEIIALAIAGTLLLIIRQFMATDWIILKPVDWFIAAIINDQLTVLMLAGLLHLQGKITPRDFWWRNAWAMPINITIGALGGALLSAAVADMGFRGILTFMVPLFLSAYAFHMYVRSAEEKFATVRGRTSELEITNHQLSQAAQRKEKALDSVSAEMSKSLNAIRESVKTMVETQNYLPRERQMMLIETIALAEQDLTKRVASLSLSDTSLDEASDLPQMRLFNFSELVEGVTAALEGDSAEKQVRMRCYAGDVPIYIEADEQMLRQVIWHLVTNAVKYTPSGGSVFVSLAVKEGKATLDVEDTGSGISKLELNRIFDPYYRGKQHETTTQGKGLGLSAVKQLVEAHDGTIEVESQVDLGSRFTVTLPMQEDVAPRDSDLMLGSAIYTTQEFFIHARETVST